MAELIKKGALSEEIESLTVHITGLRAGKGVLSKFMEEYRKSVLRTIDEQPTTTEAEIRAKAYTEVVEKLELELSESLIWGMALECDSEKIVDYVIDTAKQVAEQLKEEGGMAKKFIPYRCSECKNGMYLLSDGEWDCMCDVETDEECEALFEDDSEV